MTIVALTSHGKRLNLCAKTIFSILQQSSKAHIVLTLFKDDVKFISDDLRLMIDNDVLELLVVDKDLGPHLKYFYTMLKYPNDTIVTIDDDILYEKDMIKKLLDFSTKFPNKVIANRCHYITDLNYNNWRKEIKEHTANHRNFGTGVGGVLYPPNILKLSKLHITEIEQIKYADDIYLKILELRNNIEVVNRYNLNFKTLRNKEFEDTALYHANIFYNRNNEYINKFEQEFKTLN